MAKTKETPESPEKSDKGTQTEQPVKSEGPATKEQEANKDACMWAMFCHLAGLGAFIIPVVGNIVAPLILWQVKKDEHPFVDEQGKEALNFQISVTIYAVVSMFLFVICIGPFLLAGVGLFDFVLLLIAAVKANSGDHYRYPLTIRFIK
jgi:uncharacterized Tic20 family protein